MSWFWMNIPLAAAFFAAWVGIPLWLVIKHPDTGPPAASPGCQPDGPSALASRPQTQATGGRRERAGGNRPPQTRMVALSQVQQKEPTMCTQSDGAPHAGDYLSARSRPAGDAQARTLTSGRAQSPGLVVASYRDGQTYAAATRGHAVLTDQPAEAGGSDAAMTPVELLVAALSSCVAFYAGQYLARHRLDRKGLQVSAEFTMAPDAPARVREVMLKVRVPGGIPPGRQAALLAVASHCTVHNTLRQIPDITLELT